ncbi:MAG: hypothetical protein DRQ47_08215 [Gammaproteobacteria bacterium]|nr:MAG: hypothetical protein DRQ47_08215 [Gammaproteobacteria bacterium]
MADLEWVRFYGSVVKTNLDFGNRIVLKADNSTMKYISLKSTDVYTDDKDRVFLRREGGIRFLGSEEI